MLLKNWGFNFCPRKRTINTTDNRQCVGMMGEGWDVKPQNAKRRSAQAFRFGRGGRSPPSEGKKRSSPPLSGRSPSDIKPTTHKMKLNRSNRDLARANFWVLRCESIPSPLIPPHYAAAATYAAVGGGALVVACIALSPPLSPSPAQGTRKGVGRGAGWMGRVHPHKNPTSTQKNRAGRSRVVGND